MEARNAYDIETALSLLAEDGATVQLMNDNAMNADMGSVRLDRDELALALEAEHLYGVRFEPFRCRRASGSWRQGQIVCSYRLDNRLRRAQHMGPMRTSFRIGVRHGRIRILSFPWLNISWNPDGFLPAEYEPFVTWLEVNHPDAGGPMEPGVIFRSEGQELIHILTRKSLDLLADYLDEFERSL